VDFDGKVTYSNVVVEKYYTSGMTINVYPQPAVAHSTKPKIYRLKSAKI